MVAAIIRLEKKIIITSNEKNSHFKRLWDSINNIIEDISKRRQGQRVSWKNAFRYHKEIQEATLDYSKQALYYLDFKVPDCLNDGNKELKIEFGNLLIHDFTEEFNSLVLHFYLVTEKLLIIDNICSHLLVSNLNSIESYINGRMVENTFTIDLKCGWDIIEYSKINNDNL